MFLAALPSEPLTSSSGYLLLFILTCAMGLAVVVLAVLTVRRMRSFGSMKTASAAEGHSATEKLHEFTRSAAQVDLHQEPGPQLCALILSTFEIETAAIFDADLRKIYQAGEWSPDLENVLQNIYFFESVSDDIETGLARRVLRIGHLPIGALLMRGELSPVASDTIACLVAVTLDRYYSHANIIRSENERQTELLRTTVLDSLAHAYKTPLTAIRAASSGLNEMGNLTPAQTELVTLIDEQSSMLSDLTTRLLKTARLEGHDLTLHMETVAVAPLIDDLVASFREQLADHSVKIAVSREDLSVRCDRDLLVTLLTQYIDNAGKYSAAGSPVMIQAAESAGEIIFSVHNIGPVIPAADHDRIFDRYFRSAASTSKAAGTGLGLSVAKRAAQAHGGNVWLTSDTEHGTVFFASLLAMPEAGCSA